VIQKPQHLEPTAIFQTKGQKGMLNSQIDMIKYHPLPGQRKVHGAPKSVAVSGVN